MDANCIRCMVNGDRRPASALVSGMSLCDDHGIDAYLKVEPVSTASARDAKERLKNNRTGRVTGF